MLLHQRVYFLEREEGIKFQILIDDLVGLIEPELVKGEGRRFLCREPYGIALALTELLARSIGDEWAGEGKRLLAELPADELHAREDVGPLVGGAYLQLHAVLLIEGEVVEALQKRVGKFGVGDAVVRILKSALYDVALHQFVYGEVLADVTKEVDELHREE